MPVVSLVFPVRMISALNFTTQVQNCKNLYSFVKELVKICPQQLLLLQNYLF
jgi:hypothetical protein